MELWFFIAISVAFLLLLAVWTTRNAVANVHFRGVESSQSVLADFHITLPPVAVAKRVFAREDWEFILKYGRPELERLFLYERKNVAYSWLRRTRSGVGTLMRLRRAMLRVNMHSTLGLDLAVFLNYAVFVVFCRILELGIWWRGPFFVQTMAGYTTQFTQSLSSLCCAVLAALNNEQRSRVQAQWAATR